MQAVEGAPSNTGFFSRLLGAALLRPSVYEEVERDPQSTRQTAYVLFLVSLLQAVGQNLALKDPLVVTLGDVLPLFGLVFLIGLAGLSAWAFSVYVIGTRLFRAKATLAETWRCSGFAWTPGLVYVYPPLIPIGTAWLVVAQVVAARYALDISMPKAIATCVLGAIPFLVPLLILRSLNAILLLSI